MMDPIRHLVLVTLFMSCASAAPQFAYSTTTFQHPFLPLPFARVPYNEDLFNNDIDRSPQEAPSEPARLLPSPYHFLPATLPQAIYSEPAHILSGYSYQTLDPAGAKSQVLFVSGPNSQQLFRQNADLLQIVLPALFTAGGDNVIPRTKVDLDTKVPEQADPVTGPAESSKEEDTLLKGTSQPNDGAESRAEEDESTEKAPEDVKPTEISAVPEKANTSEEEPDKPEEEPEKSSEEEDTTSSLKGIAEDVLLKLDVSTSEASNSLKSVPPESNPSESASTEASTTSAKDDASDDSKKSDELKSDEKTSEESSSEGKASENDQTTEATVTSTTVVNAD